MEKEIQFQTPDSHIIYGTLNSMGRGQRLLIFAHGLSGNSREHQYFNAPKSFNAHGIDTFRFDFYSRRPMGRQLGGCTISTHVKDLAIVIEGFSRYKEIFLAGHSVGAIVAIRAATPMVSKIVLWDPSAWHGSLEDKRCAWNEGLGKYILSWGLEIMLSREFISEWQETADVGSLARSISRPCKLIFAGKHTSHAAWKPHLSSIIPEHEHHVVKGASHQFLEEGSEEELFLETLKFLK
jgi:pimeloyl-ACP methyl ester carboxylesterase